MARILLADDDASSRELVSRALKLDAHEITAVTDGLEALDRLDKGGAYDLLLTDVHMPGMDGVALATKALAASQQLAVVLMSGFTEELERGAALDRRRVRTLAKPFSLDQIRAAVRLSLT